MHKNDLIKKLQELEGNPEVLLWNGYVGDWTDIGNLSPSSLVKIQKDCWLESCRIKRCIERKDWSYQIPTEEVTVLSKQYTKFSWEIDEFISEEDITEKRYKKKNVVFIQPKPRGEVSFDRLGRVNY